jgi:hypothetical protein
MAAGSASIEQSLIQALASGTGASQADRIYSERAKSIAAPYSPDLSGSLLDAFGAACIFARVKALIVMADAANTGDVRVGASGANAFLLGVVVADQVAVKPGGVLVLYAPLATGYPVTAGTGDILTFTPSAGTQVFDFSILGASV